MDYAPLLLVIAVGSLSSKYLSIDFVEEDNFIICPLL